MSSGNPKRDLYAQIDCKSPVKVAGILVLPPPSSSWFAAYEGIAVDFKLTRVRFSFCTAERVDRWADANVREAATLDHLLPGCTRQTTGNSGSPKIDVGDRRCGHGFAIGNVGELEVATRLQHAPYLAEYLPFVGA
jgi:hypothetical protein